MPNTTVTDGVLHICSDFPNQSIYTQLAAHLRSAGERQFVFSAVRSDAEVQRQPPDEPPELRFSFQKVLHPLHRYFFHGKIRAARRALLGAVDPRDFSLVHAHYLYSDAALALRLKREFNLPFAHPVMEGKISCSDCHSPHEGAAVAEGGTQFDSLNTSCVKCHTAQAGPYVFEHEAAREGCVACHSPHGSMNAKMLKARNANLCLQCHFQEQTSTGVVLIGGRDHAAFLSRGTCWSAGCHEAVHGSHVSSSLRF